MRGRLCTGKSSMVHHDGKGVYRDLPNPFEAIRYHSLAIQEEGFPDCLEVTARTSERDHHGSQAQGVPG